MIIDHSPVIFLLEILAVLAVPGPTNTLLFVSGATRGFLPSLHLILAELIAYTLSTNFLIYIVEPDSPVSSSLIHQLLRDLTSIYLIYLAFKLWRWSEQNSQDSTGITFSRVFFTTMINPKNLIFAFGIFPGFGADPTMSAYFYSFSPICLVVACCWIAGGATLFSLEAYSRNINYLYRGEAILLVGFAIMIFLSTYS